MFLPDLPKFTSNPPSLLDLVVSRMWPDPLTRRAFIALRYTGVSARSRARAYTANDKHVFIKAYVSLEYFLNNFKFFPP